jgi:2-keto-4-pentenoate hydratase
LTLARCRRARTLCRLPLDKFGSRAHAEAFQAAAVQALGGNRCGYKIGATSLEVQRLLNCHEPIYAPILSEDVLSGGSTFQIPPGLLGGECEFGFLLDRDFPPPAGSVNRNTLTAAVAECFMGLELVGRRVTNDTPLNEYSAVADFALNAAVIRGETIPNWDRSDLAAMPVLALLDGQTVVKSVGASVLGHPLNALAWLATALQRRGVGLRAGEIVMTGTCTGITAVSPGQTFAGCFSDFAPVEVRLT